MLRRLRGVGRTPAVGRRGDVHLADVGRAGDVGASAHYADPGYYTAAYRTRRHDVRYYVERARESGGTVLECGVGNGRVALPIARAGIAVTGIDRSRPMLADLERRRAREPRAVRERLRSGYGDLRHFHLGERFALVIAPFNTILHLYTHADVTTFLACAAEHLAPNGELVFDWSVPVPADLARDPRRVYPARSVRHPLSAAPVPYAERFEYDPMRQLLLVHLDFSPVDGPPFTVPLTHRQFFPAELLALVADRGFELTSVTADFTAEPAHDDADVLVVRARPRHRPPVAGATAHR
ncbi:MAG: class I SAM-dependent methyltransferase [Polyangiaceae bacterium]|nr:class I SAM-dependent methyltransferase [Polyangiaceae bacterium]